MLTREQAHQLTEKILSYSKFPDCGVNVSESERAYIRFANNGVTTSGFAVERSINISSTKDGRTGSISTNDIDDAALKAAVARSEEMALLSPPNQEYIEPVGPQEYPTVDHFDAATAAARGTQMAPHVRAILDVALKNKLVAAGLFERSAGIEAIANKRGNFGWARSADSSLTTTMRAPDGSSSGWCGKPALRIAEINGQELAEIAAKKCMAWGKPKKLEPGAYTVVLEPTAVGDLLGSAAYEMMARDAEEGRSVMSKPGGRTRLGEKMFPEFVTLRTDPFDPRVAADPWSQGNLPNRRIAWIEKGVVKNLAYDRYWAKKTGKEPTPFPNALILEGGDETLAGLIKSVDRGLLVTRFWYIRTVNPQTAQVTGLTRDGLFLIEKGEVTSPVMNFRFNESPVKLLQNTTKLGPNVRTQGAEGGGVVPPLVANDFHFTSVSDAI